MLSMAKGKEDRDTAGKGARFRSAYLLIALCSLAFAILYGAAGSFWYDEFAQISFSGPGMSLVDSALVLDPTPPLFNVLANIWYHAVPYGDRWLLLLPQLAMAAAVFLAGLWGESLGGRSVGLWTALFLGFSQMVMEQCGFEFRGYAFLLLFSTAAFLLHGKRASGGAGRVLLCALVLTGLMYSHIFGGLLAFTLGLWDLLPVLKRKAPVLSLLPYLIAVLCFLPWMAFFLIHVAAEASATPSIWMVKPTPWEVIKLGAYLCGNHIVLCALCLLGAVLVCRGALRAKKEAAPDAAETERLLPLFSMALCVALVYVYGVTRKDYASLWEKRYFTGLFPCAALYCALGAASLIRETGKRFAGRRRAGGGGGGEGKAFCGGEARLRRDRGGLPVRLDDPGVRLQNGDAEHAAGGLSPPGGGGAAPLAARHRGRFRAGTEHAGRVYRGLERLLRRPGRRRGLSRQRDRRDVAGGSERLGRDLL